MVKKKKADMDEYVEFYLDEIDFKLVGSEGDTKTNFESKKINQGDLFSYIFMKKNHWIVNLEDFQQYYKDSDEDGGIDLFFTNENIGYIFQNKSGEIDIDNLKKDADNICHSLNYSFSNKKINKSGNSISENRAEEIKNEFGDNIETIEIYFIVKKLKKNNFFKQNEDFENHLNSNKTLNNKYSKKELNFNIIEFGKEGLNEIFANDLEIIKDKKLIYEKFKFFLSTPPLYKHERNVSGYIISAKIEDIYKLYQLYKEKLFLYNVRGYISKEKKQSRLVNKDIFETLQSNPSDFWFKNNGIFLVSKEMEISFNAISIKSFSIINGAQTVTNIFNFINEEENKIAKEKDDVKKELLNLKLLDVLNSELLVKIVNLNQITQDTTYIKNLVKSSNLQKPVSNWTFYYDDPLILEIKNNIEKNKSFYLKNKEGTFDKKNNPSIKYLELPEYTQYAYAIFSLTPGKSIQSKLKLFENDEKFKKILENKIIKHNETLPFIINSFVNEKLKKNPSFDKKNVQKLKMWIMSLISIYWSFNSSKTKELIKNKIKEYKTSEEAKIEFNNWLINDFNKTRIFKKDLLKEEHSQNIIKVLENKVKVLSDYSIEKGWITNKDLFHDNYFYDFLFEKRLEIFDC